MSISRDRMRSASRQNRRRTEEMFPNRFTRYNAPSDPPAGHSETSSIDVMGGRVEYATARSRHVSRESRAALLLIGIAGQLRPSFHHAQRIFHLIRIGSPN